MNRTALAFMSYVNLDDQHEQGRLTRRQFMAYTAAGAAGLMLF
ncbi:MAG: twin-arginine translocation signal domain-containing protein [Candidatus Electrothrix sp. MAN1_4]|nr:twin-arginine translocation signal domain-containing protein [Candidatus Electrothrix sp. MAN1_4]